MELEKKTRKLSGFQKIIKDRLFQSYSQNVHTSMFLEICAEAIISKRKAYEQATDSKIPFYAYILEAVAQSIAENPVMNCSYENDLITENDEVNIGIALDFDGKLIVPNIKGCKDRSIEFYAQEIARLTEAARTSKLTRDEISGGTFTVNNLGALGIDSFTAIVNPPQVAILNIGKINKRVELDEAGQPTSVSYINFGLSINHCVINGSHGAKFLNTIKQHLEQ